MTDYCYTLLSGEDSSELPAINELKTQLEKGDDEDKIETMKKIIILMLNGDPMPQLLMFVIRFVMPSKNKTLKKMLLIYWEIVQKKNPDGKLKQEFILVCNALRNDLNHPNEFIRGNTLRFLCKMKEPEILEPLLPSVRSCLEHRHSYVRRNAVLTIYMIYKQHEYLIPDASDVILHFIASESDMSCKRNAFLMLYNCDQEKAVEYLSSVINQVHNFAENLQIIIVELIRKVSKHMPSEKPKYIKCIFELLNSPSNAVKYEAAAALMTLTSAPTAVKAAASCYVNLILKESDNNIKLIVLDRINELREKHDHVLDDLAMDILRVLSSPDIEVRRKCLSVVMQLVSSKNTADVVAFLKKEILKTNEQESEKNNEYRQLLIGCIHNCAIKFPDVASSVINTLIESILFIDSDSASDVISFIKEVVERYGALRHQIVQKLMDSFSEIKDSKVFRGALWVLGEYSLDLEALENAFNVITNVLGEVPIVDAELREAQLLAEKLESGATTDKGSIVTSSRVTVLADGTYSTQSSLTVKDTPLSLQLKQSRKNKPLRSLLLEGEFFLGSLLSVTLTKMAFRYATFCKDQAKVNSRFAQVMLTISSILRLGTSDLVPQQIDPDNFERTMTCLRVLLDPKEDIIENFLKGCRHTFSILLENKKNNEEKKSKSPKVLAQPEDLIIFRQLKSRKANTEDFNDQYEMDLNKATGSKEDDDLLSKLSRIVQLTGHSDPVYAEAYVNVNQYDILLDILVVNQTGDTLQNLTLELATLGDLKLVERPSTHTLAPHDFLSIRANIKVSSTETGVIFGNIVYEIGTQDASVVVLNDIHIDILDYIHPNFLTPTSFRQMWAEFEWENKVLVNTQITNLRDYLNHIIKQTNMCCLTPKSALEGECDFLAANLAARSIFGEDALANICIEKTSGKIVGHLRIRSKTQGIALSLGDKITLSQKELPEED